MVNFRMLFYNICFLFVLRTSCQEEMMHMYRKNVYIICISRPIIVFCLLLFNKNEKNELLSNLTIDIIQNVFNVSQHIYVIQVQRTTFR